MDPTAEEIVLAARGRVLEEIGRWIVDADELGAPPPSWQGRAADAYAARRADVCARLRFARAEVTDAVTSTRVALVAGSAGG